MNSLVAFEAAARHGNFTRAAEELSVAQPAVTRHISNVEDWLGVRLFHRKGNVVDLTEEGKQLSQLSTAALDRLELGIRNVRRVRRDELVIGASFGVAHLWVMPRISEMRKASGVNINLITSDNYETFDDLTVDLSIRFGNGDFGSHQADLLFPEKCQIIASPGFLAENPGLDPSNPAHSVDNLVMLDHGDPHAIGWMDWRIWHEMVDCPFPGADKLTTVKSYPTMLDMVCAGEGISIGTIGIEDDLLASGKICGIGPVITRPGFGYYLVYKEEQLLRPSLRKLRRYLIGDQNH